MNTASSPVRGGNSLPRDRFQKEIRAHLAVYKREVLGLAENGVWRKNGQPYPHILPIDQRRLNILPSIQDDFWRWFDGRRIKLHSDFHHLNSSQALCFNLFFPLMSGNGRALEMVMDALGIREQPTAGAAFEFQPNEIEGTCFDFAIPTASGARVYFELKYTESDFGAARADARHLDKFHRVYQPGLVGRFDDPFCVAEYFLANYQIVRNIWHLNHAAGDVVVFLYPGANSLLHQKEEIIRNCAIEPFRSRVHIVYLESLIAALRQDTRCTDGQISALAEFQAKYLPCES
jgi:hypothetical protein